MENLKAIIAITVIFLGIPLALLLVRDILRRVKVRNPMFWGFAPVLFVFAVLIPLCIEGWTPAKIILIAGMELCAAFGLIGLYDAHKFFWAFRGLTAVIFLAYASYVVHEFAFTDKPLTLEGRKSDASPRNALLGLAVIVCLAFGSPSPGDLHSKRKGARDP